MRLACYFALALASSFHGNPLAQASPQTQEGTKPAGLTSAEVSRLREQANAGDSSAQGALGHAYQDGNGVPKDPTIAVQWYRKSAEQGNANAENDLGIMYSSGEGVPRDKEEAVKWYARAAKHGNSKAMFNLGASYYNGDGVGEDQIQAYSWFLIGQDAGNTSADAAAKRSAATLSGETADAYQRISEMYEKGDELPKDDAQALRWLKKAADRGPGAKVVLAMRYLNGPEAVQHYSEAFELCKAAEAESEAYRFVYPPAVNCIAGIYRRGLGVNTNPSEAIKWYQKAAPHNAQAAHELAGMYATGEGTKLDRPEAFMMFFQAASFGMKDARQEALAVWQNMDTSEQRKTADKIRKRRLDPAKVIAALQK
jgi:TPR repeat protein